jgi:hypothetical protein
MISRASAIVVLGQYSLIYRLFDLGLNRPVKVGLQPALLLIDGRLQLLLRHHREC